MHDRALHGPVLSIICPVFNLGSRTGTFWRHLHAVLALDLALEVIVIDDGSRDDTWANLQQHRHGLAAGMRRDALRLHHQSNQGLSGARNVGIELAHGNFILFLDDDDQLHPAGLAALLKLLPETEAAVIGLAYDEQSETTTAVTPPYPDGIVMTGAAYFIDLLLSKDRFITPAWAYCYRRSHLLNHQLRFKPGIYHEDCLFTPQALIEAESITVLHAAVYVYIRRADSITLSADERRRERRVRDLGIVVRDLLRYCNRLTDEHAGVHGLHAALVRWSFFLLNYQHELCQGGSSRKAAWTARTTAIRLLAGAPRHLLRSSPYHQWYRDLLCRIILGRTMPRAGETMIDAFTGIPAKLSQWNRRRLQRRHAAAHSGAPAAGAQQQDGMRFIDMPGGSSRPFFFRPASVGDQGVVKQIFDDHEYEIRQWAQGRAIMELFNRRQLAGVPSFILDAGANIGASAVFFCRMFPGAKVLCVEPEAGNVHLLRKNTEGLDAIVFEGALGAEPGTMFLHDPGESDWGFRVTHEALSTEVPVRVFSVREIESHLGPPARPLMCKIDIEGGEGELFSRHTDWIDHYPLIVIELHDWMLPGQGTSLNFLREIAQRDIEFLQKGENLYVFNPGACHAELKQLES